MKKLLIALALSSLGIANAQTTEITQTASKPVEPVITVTLLGTGVPLLNAAALAANGRALSGLLVQAGTERMLFDCGQGVYSRLVESGGPATSPNIGVDKLFISHLHSDHIGDLGALYAVGALYRYVNPTDPAADDPLRVWGPSSSSNQPTSTYEMMQAFHVGYETDFYVRQLFTNPLDFSLTNAAVKTRNTVKDLHSGLVYESNGVKVTAFLVDHDPMTPAYGFRIDYKGRSFVYSGDTTYSANLIHEARNVDLLVHEVYGYTRDEGPEIYDYHTSPELAATIFNAAKPKNVVYTHLVIPPGTTANDLVTRTRAAGYSGPLTPGVDLMVITVNSNNTITIAAPGTAAVTSAEPATSDFMEIYRAHRRRGQN
jgi:ribonuclease Z